MFRSGRFGRCLSRFVGTGWIGSVPGGRETQGDGLPALLHPVRALADTGRDMNADQRQVTARSDPGSATGSPTALVRGVNDVGSAVAHALFRAGYGVVLHDGPSPATSRRGMAFADAVFDGEGILAGVRACRLDDLAQLAAAL